MSNLDFTSEYFIRVAKTEDLKSNLKKGYSLQKILVLGKSGQIARAWKSWASMQTNYDFDFWGRDVLDFSKFQYKDLQNAKNYDVLINTVAFTQVDTAEKEQDMAFRINSESLGLIGKFCLENDKWLIHYSTDYVYSGQGKNPWNESDKTGPKNIYGESKLKGDQILLSQNHKAILFRTSWVYAEEGKNFVNSILRLASEKEELKIVSDQLGSPTYAPHLIQANAQVMNQVFKKNINFCEILHCCNAGTTNWYEFAEAIILEARKRQLPLKVKKLTPLSSQDYPSLAERPLNSRLSLKKISQMFGVSMPTWQEGLQSYFERKYGN